MSLKEHQKQEKLDREQSLTNSKEGKKERRRKAHTRGSPIKLDGSLWN